MLWTDGVMCVILCWLQSQGHVVFFQQCIQYLIYNRLCYNGSSVYSNRILVSIYKIFFRIYLLNKLDGHSALASNNRHGLLNYRSIECLSNSSFRLTTKKHQRSALLSLYEGNPPVAGGFPAQRDSNAENVSVDDVTMTLSRRRDTWKLRTTIPIAYKGTRQRWWTNDPMVIIQTDVKYATFSLTRKLNVNIFWTAVAFAWKQTDVCVGTSVIRYPVFAEWDTSGPVIKLAYLRVQWKFIGSLYMLFNVNVTFFVVTFEIRKYVKFAFSAIHRYWDGTNDSSRKAWTSLFHITIPWLMMALRYKEPNHHQPWYCLFTHCCRNFLDILGNKMFSYPFVKHTNCIYHILPMIDMD